MATGYPSCFKDHLKSCHVTLHFRNITAPFTHCSQPAKIRRAMITPSRSLRQGVWAFVLPLTIREAMEHASGSGGTGLSCLPATLTKHLDVLDLPLPAQAEAIVGARRGESCRPAWQSVAGGGDVLEGASDGDGAHGRGAWSGAGAGAEGAGAGASDNNGGRRRFRIIQRSSLPSSQHTTAAAAAPSNVTGEGDPGAAAAAGTSTAGTGTTGTTLWLGAQVMAAYLSEVLPDKNKKGRRGRGGGGKQGSHGEQGEKARPILELGGGVGYLA